MSISLVAHTIAVAGTPGITVTTSGITTTGANFIVVAIANFQTNTTQVSDSNSNSWTPLTVYNGNQAGAAIQLFYVFSPTVGSGHTFTQSDSGNVSTSASIAVAAFSGVAAYENQQSGAAPLANTNSVQPGSVTPAHNGDLLITAVADSTTTSDTQPTSFTMTDSTAEGSNNFGLALAYFVQATATSINPTWTLGTQGNTGDTNGVTLAAFRATVSGTDIPWGFSQQPTMGAWPQIVSV